MGADDQQLELHGALEALGGSAGNGKLRDLLGWDEATYDAVKAPLVASGQLQPGRGCGGSVSLTDKVDSGSSAAADLRPAASPRTPRTVSPPTPDPQPSGKQILSAFILSVADLLRVAGQAFCNTSALSMKRLMGDQDNICENLRSYIQAFTPREVIKLMVNLIFIEDGQALTQGGHRPQPLRPHRGHRRHAQRGRGTPGGDEPRELRDLQGRHADQGAGHQKYPLRQHARR